MSLAAAACGGDVAPPPRATGIVPEAPLPTSDAGGARDSDLRPVDPIEDASGTRGDATDDSDPGLSPDATDATDAPPHDTVPDTDPSDADLPPDATSLDAGPADAEGPDDTEGDASDGEADADPADVETPDAVEPDIEEPDTVEPDVEEPDPHAGVACSTTRDRICPRHCSIHNDRDCCEAFRPAGFDFCIYDPTLLCVCSVN